MILIKGGLIRPVTSADIPDGDILIDNGKIAAIGKNLTAPEGTQIIDAKGLLVTPGFIDAHCHIGISEEAVRWEGEDCNEYSDPMTAQLRSIDGINPMDEAYANAVSGGVTTVCTGPGSANVIGGTFTAMKTAACGCVDDMVVKAPAAMKIAFGENPKSCYGENGNKMPKTRMAVAAVLRDTLMKAKRYDAEIAEAEADPSKKRPYDQQLEAMLPVVRGEIPLKAHAHRADDMLTAVRVAREYGVKLTLDHCTEGHLIADKLAEFGYPTLVGPSMTNKSKPELKNKTLATPGILAKKGLEVCIITDAPVIPIEYLSLCAGLAVKAGMDEEAAWRAITINPAHVIGISDRVGSLEVGKDADICLFDGNPLKDIGYETRCVLVDGKVAYKG